MAYVGSTRGSVAAPGRPTSSKGVREWPFIEAEVLRPTSGSEGARWRQHVEKEAPEAAEAALAAGQQGRGGAFYGRLVSAHADPLAAVQRGEASCVVVRSVFTSAQRANIVRRFSRYIGDPASRGWQTASRHDVGATMDVFKSEGSANYWRTLPRINAMFDAMFEGAARNDTDDDVDGLGVFRHVLDLLARRSGKSVGVPTRRVQARNGTTTATIPGPPAIFHTHKGPGSGFATHLDGFHQQHYEDFGPDGSPLPRNAGGQTLKRHRRTAASAAESASAGWPAVMSARYGPHDVLSAVLVLEQDARMGPPGLLYNLSLTELLGPDGKPVSPNVRGNSGWININFATHPIHSHIKANAVSHASPMLHPGDMYVFSASRVHETFDVVGSRRAVMATFLAWNSFEEGGKILLFQ